LEELVTGSLPVTGRGPQTG